MKEVHTKWKGVEILSVQPVTTGNHQYTPGSGGFGYGYTTGYAIAFRHEGESR